MKIQEFIKLPSHEKILINLLILVISILIIKNYVDKHLKYVALSQEQKLSISQMIKLNLDNRDQTLYVLEYNNKKNFSKNLINKESYEVYFNRKCSDMSGSLAERHRVRWLIKLMELKLYEFLYSLNNNMPYYAHFIGYGVFLWLGMFVCFQAFGMTWKNICIYLFSISFIFQHELSEYGYSIIETLMIAIALWASKNKYYFVFIIALLVAALNRESGFILIAIWFIFNRNIKFPVIAFGITSGVFLTVNYDIINCFINPNFFISFEHQKGQFNFSDVGHEISYISTLRVVVNNFIIPLGFAVFIYLKNPKNSHYIFALICFYYLIFLVATPLHHISVKMITIPLIILLANSKLIKLK